MPRNPNRPRYKPVPGPCEVDPTGLTEQQLEIARAFKYLEWKKLCQDMRCLKPFGPGEPRDWHAHTFPMANSKQGRLNYAICPTCANKYKPTHDTNPRFSFATSIHAILDALKNFNYDSDFEKDQQSTAVQDKCVKCEQTVPCQQIHFWHEKWSTDFEDGKDNIPAAKSGDLRQYSLCSECYPLEEEAGEPEGSSAAEQASVIFMPSMHCKFPKDQ